MTDTDNNLHDNFYDAELIVEFLRGVLPGDLHLKIQEQIKASEMFRTYVEGVQIKFEQSGKNFEKMEADIAEKKARTWSKLQQKAKPKTTLREQIAYAHEQLVEYFTPNPQLELAMQTTRGATTSQAQITVDDTNQILTLILPKKNTQVIDFKVISNKIQAAQQHQIPVGSDNFTLSTASMHPGIYYAELKATGTEPQRLRFYIREDLKPI